MTTTISPISNKFITSADGVRMPIWIKDPDDVEDYTLDWTNHLVDDDTIVAAVFNTGDPALNVISTNYDTPTATCWLSAGVLGTTYNVICHITTAHGRQHDRTFQIQIAQK